jgi:hypothetical protein
MKDHLSKALYVQKVAERLGVDEATLQRSLPALHGGSGQRGYRQPVSQRTPPAQEAGIEMGGSAPGAFGGGRRIERQIISMMLQYPRMVIPVRNEGLLDHFEDPHLKAIGEAVLEQERTGDVSAVEVMGRCEDPALKRLVAALSMAEERWDAVGCDRLLAQCRAGIQKRQDTLIERIRAAEAAGDLEQIELLQRQLLEKSQKRRMKSPR